MPWSPRVLCLSLQRNGLKLSTRRIQPCTLIRWVWKVFLRPRVCCLKLTFLQDSSEDDDIGPAMPSSAPKKKRRVLPYEKLYISALPSSPRYSKSLMHKDQLSFVTMTPFTDFLITSSIDGVVKFWKKVAVGIEPVKEFKAHIGEIRSVSVSRDGRSFATAGIDKTLKIFDVITFGRFTGARGVPKVNDGQTCSRYCN